MCIQNGLAESGSAIDSASQILTRSEHATRRMKKLKEQFKAEILQSESVAESDDEADEADEDASTPARCHSI